MKPYRVTVNFDVRDSLTAALRELQQKLWDKFVDGYRESVVRKHSRYDVGTEHILPERAPERRTT